MTHLVRAQPLLVTSLPGLPQASHIFPLSSSATARVVRFGRQPSLTAFQIARAQENSGAGKPIAEIAKIFGDRASIYRVLAAPRALSI